MLRILTKVSAVCLIWVMILFLLAKGWMERALLDFEMLFNGEAFNFPVHIEFKNIEGQNIALISEKAGRILWRTVTEMPENGQMKGVVLDLSHKVYSRGQEDGLLSTVFDPRFPAKPYIYVFYSSENPLLSRISRFSVDSQLRADPKSELNILTVAQFKEGHNGGMMAFDKNGYLFASFGDSHTSDESPDELLSGKTLLGSIVRIDVRDPQVDKPYHVPPDNPFVGNQEGKRTEIWAYGMRNPWRFNLTEKELIAIDVGSNQREEINFITSAGNYGWPAFEGEICLLSEKCGLEKDIIKPTASLDHVITRSITGAVRYRGQIKSLQGRVVFADYLRGVFSVKLTEDSSITTNARREIWRWPTTSGEDAGETFLQASLQEGPDHEIYIVGKCGPIVRLAPIGWWKYVRAMLYAMLNFR